MLRKLFFVVITTVLSACGGGIGNQNSGKSNDLSPGLQSSSRSMLPSSLSASSDVDNSSVENIYGLYVSLLRGGNNHLLGNSQREEEFIEFIAANGFNYLIFYGLEGLNPTSTMADQFASLVSRARARAGVVQVAAALGRVEEAETVVAYNANHSWSERIDVLNVEYEFWNEPDRRAAFATTISMLERFRTVAQANHLKTEIYIGWVEPDEAVGLANVTDRILVHFYRQNDVGIINYGLERLEWMAAASRRVQIAPIFSNEGPKNTFDLPFMGCWLEENDHHQAYRSWKSQYDALNKDWQQNIHAVGSIWYVYDKFLDVNKLNGQLASIIDNGCDQ